MIALILLPGFGCSSTPDFSSDKDAAVLNTIRPFGDSITYGVGFSPLAEGLLLIGDTPGGGYRGWMTWMYFARWGVPPFSTTGLMAGASNRQQWWPNMFINTAVHDGYPGWRNDQLIAIASLKPGRPATKTLVHAGTNDFLQGADAGTAQSRLKALLKMLRSKNGGTTLYVAQIIPVNANKYKPLLPTSPTAATINANINTYNKAIPGILGSYGKAVPVDMHNILTEDDDYISDGIHPSCRGYLKMACTWVGAITGKGLPANCNPLNPAFKEAVANVCKNEPKETRISPRDILKAISGQKK